MIVISAIGIAESQSPSSPNLSVTSESLPYARDIFQISMIDTTNQFFPARSSLGQHLYIVEGVSAANALCAVREPHQAVYAMQGKPKNTLHIAQATLLADDSFSGLINVLGAGSGDECLIHNLQFDKVIVLMDPNADGMHCLMLMLLFFYRWLNAIFDAGRLFYGRAPLAAMTQGSEAEVKLAWDEVAVARLVAQSDLEAANGFHLTRYAGLASIPADVLHRTCLGEAVVQPLLTMKSAERAVSLLG